METRDILCASDLSQASTRAVACAGELSARTGRPVKLLHVLERSSDAEWDQALALLKDQIMRHGGNGHMEPLLLEGDPLEVITEESARGHGLLILATHGLRGLRQKLFGADILKLVRRVPLPSIVVQEESPLRFDSGPVVMPVAAHEDVMRLVDAAIQLVRTYGTEIHIYHLHRTGEEASDELLRNKQMMLERIQASGVHVKEVNEPSNSPSISFAGPTLEYAARIGASCVAIMRHASKEYRYMADAEKERMLTNDERIPILCC
jgi:nucleotide-binding universal stress UspA family protein